MLTRFSHALVSGGIIYISVKRGQGEGWERTSYEEPRFFAYWQPGEIDSCIRLAGYQIVDASRDPSGRDEWLIRFVSRSKVQHLVIHGSKS